MISIDEVELILDEIAEELPAEFYKDLNGGIILMPEAKLHNQSMDNDLYIMGEYHREGNLGSFIAIYYGSFAQVYGHVPKEELKERLKHTLKHEFRHHLEFLSGEKDLELEDEDNLEKYIIKKLNH